MATTRAATQARIDVIDAKGIGGIIAILATIIGGVWLYVDSNLDHIITAMDKEHEALREESKEAHTRMLRESNSYADNGRFGRFTREDFERESAATRHTVASQFSRTHEIEQQLTTQTIKLLDNRSQIEKLSTRQFGAIEQTSAVARKVDAIQAKVEHQDKELTSVAGKQDSVWQRLSVVEREAEILRDLLNDLENDLKASGKIGVYSGGNHVTGARTEERER